MERRVIFGHNEENIESEWILKSGEEYLFKITNTTVSTIDVTATLFCYDQEVIQKNETGRVKTRNFYTVNRSRFYNRAKSF